MPHKRAKRSVREKRRAAESHDMPPAAQRVLDDEAIPKSVSRVLDAANVRREWAEKKRKTVDAAEGPQGQPPSKKRRKDGAGVDAGKAQLKIQPGESMAHFNRRVEDSLRSTVREAMQTSAARVRRAKKEEEEAAAAKKKGKAAPKEENAPRKGAAGKGRDADSRSDEEDTQDAPRQANAKRKRDGPIDFEKVSSSAPKRLNDIVQAPPTLKKLPRRAKAIDAASGATGRDGTKSLKDGVLSMAQKAMMEEERDRAIRMYREMKKGNARS